MSSRPGFRIRTGIGRPLDVNHPSNRYVAVATVLAGLGTLAWRGITGADDIWLWSFRLAGAVFLAWAVAREIDPDDTLSAGIATVVAVPLVALGAPSLLSVAALLIAARIAVRTTGISPHLIDGAVLTIGAAYLGARPETWPALGVLILAVGTDRFAQPPGPDRTLWFGAAMTLGAVVTALAFADPPGWTQPTIPEWGLLGITAVAGFLAAVNTRPVASRADYHDSTLSEARLRFGRVLVLFTLVVGVIYLGGPIIPSLAPVWASAIAVTVVHYYRMRANREPKTDDSGNASGIA
ncbi:MAG: hypothetical protein HKN80_03840 [Acidimicrobiia bacterium]|nr:hypothetical protein [Acidimicrobiia bacterium]